MKFNNGSSRHSRMKRNGGRSFRPNNGQNGSYRQGNGHNPQRSSGHWRQQIDKYLAQGKDALSGGDLIAAENCFQHAEHFQRMLAEAAPEPVAAYPQPQMGDPSAEQPSIEQIAIASAMADEELAEERTE